MTLEEAINVSQIHAARGYTEKGECIVSVAFYGQKLVWLTGFGGEWAKKWKPVDEEERKKIEGLNFKPTGPKPEEQIEQEVIDAITEIVEDEDDFEPIGERDE